MFVFLLDSNETFKCVRRPILAFGNERAGIKPIMFDMDKIRSIIIIRLGIISPTYIVHIHYTLYIPVAIVAGAQLKRIIPSFSSSGPNVKVPLLEPSFLSNGNWSNVYFKDYDTTK